MKGPGGVPRQIFYGVYAFVALAVIFAIAGGATATYSATIPFHAKALSKIAIIILILTFLVMNAVDIVLLVRLRHVARGENVPLIAITVGSPFFASRLIFSCISAYHVSPTFNPVVGNVYVQAFMSIFEEFTIVLLYSFACFETPPAEPRLSDESSRSRESSESRDPSMYYDTETGLREDRPSGDAITTVPDQLGSTQGDAGKEGGGRSKADSGVDIEVGQGIDEALEMKHLSQRESIPEVDQRRISRKASLMDSIMDLSTRDAPGTRDSKASTVVDRWDRPG